MKRLLFALGLAAASFGAHAQYDYSLIGAAVRSRPDWDGAATRTVDVIPVLRLYGQHLFARTTQGVLEGGARLELTKGVVGGLQLAYEAGPRDEDPGASFGAHLEVDGNLGPSPFTLLLRHRQYADSERGWQADFRASAGIYHGGPAVLFAFAQFTFANAENNRAYYGVNDSGLLYTDLGLLGSYDIAQSWTLVSSLHVRRITSDIINRSAVGSRQHNTYFSFGVAYKY